MAGPKLIFMFSSSLVNALLLSMAVNAVRQMSLCD